MSEITDILDNFDGSARTEKLLPILYSELREVAAAQMSREGAKHTLQATALVHEAYIRLLGDTSQNWQNRGHFLAAAAQAMRRILVEHARRKKSQRRGGKNQLITLREADAVAVPINEQRVELDDALTQMARTRPDAAELVQLRVFAGLTTAEAGKILGIPERTARRTWQYARAWLRREMNSD